MLDEVAAKIDIDHKNTCLPPVQQIINHTGENVLPQKSADIYQKQYEIFATWCAKRGIKNYTENVFLVYFSEKAKTCKPSTLWSTYSMLKSTIMIKHNINISKYTKLIAFIKQKNTGYKPKKPNIFTRDDVHKFLIEAPDQMYLMWKVIVLFVVNCL